MKKDKNYGGDDVTSQLVLYMSELNLTDVYQSRTLYFCETSEVRGSFWLLFYVLHTPKQN